MLRTAKGRAAILAALPFLFLIQVATAASLDVSPIRVKFAAGQRSHVVTVRNTGDADISVQADPVEWSQDSDGIDVYTPAGTLLVVPRIFTIAPGDEQIVRLGRVSAESGDLEGSHRVFFTELAPSRGAGEAPGLSMRLRLGIPVFVAPASEPEPRLDLVSTEQIPGGVAVVLSNQGNVHIQVLDISGHMVGPDQPEAVSARVTAYLLPGTTRKFALRFGQGAVVSSLSVTTDTAGTVEYALPYGR
ncbi:MAG: fimbria/pilus periplasmic chaperone [Chromatiales bacterium]|jgi:fimbrial chaperone protein|nr:fimbria/pilus periplasmic chaperone [Chromatiales bacterium]